MNINSEQIHTIKTYGLSYGLVNLNLFFGHPIDRLKFATQTSKETRSWKTVKKLIMSEPRNLYAGFSASAIRQNIKPLYRIYLTTIFPKKVEEILSNYNLSPLSKCVAMAMGSCTLDTTLTTPLEVIKSQQMKVKGKDRRLVNIIKSVYKSRGFKGFYSGLTPGFFKSFPSWFFLFYSYHHFSKKVSKDSPMSYPTAFTAGVISSIPNTLVTTPPDVIKNVMQADANSPKKTKLSFIATAKKIVKSDGVLRLFRGFGFRVFHKAQNVSIAFIIKDFYDRNFD